MTNFNDFLNEQMKDPEFKAEWDALDPEFAVIEAILAARKESGLTQQQLSERTGIAQALGPNMVDNMLEAERLARELLRKIA